MIFNIKIVYLVAKEAIRKFVKFMEPQMLVTRSGGKENKTMSLIPLDWYWRVLTPMFSVHIH